MKVLDLRCGEGHVYEGWFASEADYLSQVERSQVACPLCGDTAVLRLPSAPRLNVARAEAPAEASSSQPSPTVPVTMQAQWLQAVRHVMSSTEDVGERFPEEARRIHYGEVAERGIRGRASQEDAEALREEGIEIVSMPIPAAVKGPVQ